MTHIKFQQFDGFDPPVRRISRVFLHCSASDNPKHDDPRVIESWHLDRGFAEIGYHYFVSKDGTIWCGRDLEKTPAAQQGNNTGTIAICSHGLANFTDAELQATRDLCSLINSAYAGDLTFWGHREVEPGKTCPVYDWRALLQLDEDRLMPLE